MDDDMTVDEQVEFYRNLGKANHKDRIILTACQSDILTLRKVARKLDKMCVSTAWDSVEHLQTHINELISDLIDMQEEITDRIDEDERNKE
tara:strand:- start:2213 stop:2485 length:273 start_codon:yes stop_codon:yes gene_type:complete